MKHEHIDDKARVWVVMRGDDGRLQEEVDPRFLLNLNPGHSAEQIADALVLAAGTMDVEETRLW